MAPNNHQKAANTDHHAGPPRPSRQDRLAQLALRRSKLSDDEAALLREVFPIIFYVYYDKVWDHVRRRGLDSDEAEDIAQEAFLTLYHRILEHGFPDSILGMLLEMAEGKRLNHKRATKRAPFSDDPVSSRSEPPRSGLDIDRALDLHEVRQRAIPQLSMTHWEVLDKVVVHGFSYSEAAEALGIPVDTLKSRLMAAKRAFQAVAEPLLPPSQR